jgi:glucosyl-3-phosphoglycerate synthase
MSNYAQKHTKITTFYLLESNPNLKSQLRHHSKWKKAVLIVPLLASEYKDQKNRPVFENLLKQLRSASYLSKIILGVDQAEPADVSELARLVDHHGLKNCLIQYNDGPGFTSIYDKLSEAGFGLEIRGKGRNMFLSFGIAIALGAQSVGLVDADIRSFRRQQLDRLFYPVQVLNYQFSKAFYARLHDGQMFGRVKRLLLDPLLIALKRKFTETKQVKVLRLVDFLLTFNYQLSGEVVFNTSLLQRMHFSMNWGVEIFTLIETYRKATNIAQVEISRKPFDHKHQPISMTDREKGLHKMATDVVTTLLNALVTEEGLEISDYFIRDLTLTYLDVADSLIKMYADNAAFSGLEYDMNMEERMAHGVVKDAILSAGDLLTSPYQLSNRFSNFVVDHDSFDPFVSSGLLHAISEAAQKTQDRVFETPHTVSWERVQRKLPNILYEIIDVVEKEKKLYRH